MAPLAMRRETCLAGIAACSTPIASAPSAIHATKEKDHAKAERCRQIESNPARIAMAAAANQLFGELCQRLAMPMPMAKAAAIHSAGNFILVDANAQPSPCEMFAGKDQTCELRQARSQLVPARRDRAREWEVRTIRK
jgi:hypothetical protein